MSKILIVDDNKNIRYELKELFISEKFIVELACNGEEAYLLAAKNLPDLIISDILMPGGDGYSLCRNIRRDEKLKKIPFVFFTASYTDEDDKKLGLALGADAFILKLAPPEELLAKVRELLNSPATERLNKQTGPDELALLEAYNNALVRKLEKKILEIKEKNIKLEDEKIARRDAEIDYHIFKEKYFTLFNYAQDSIAILKENKITECNEAFLKLFNTTREKTIGLPISNHSPKFQPDGSVSSEKEFALINSALDGNTQVYEWEYKKSENKNFVAEASLASVNITGEKLLLMIIRDISFRKNEENIRRENENRLRQLAQATFEGLVFMRNGIVLDINNQICEMTGFSREELIGSRVMDFISPESKSEAAARLKNISDEKYEISILRKDGSKILALVQGKTILWDKKEIRVAAINDISRARKTEEELKLAKFTIESFSDAVYWLDSEGVIINVNQTSCKMLGYTKDEILDLKIFDINKSLDHEKWQRLWEQLRKCKFNIFETIHTKKDGSLIPVEITANIFTFGNRELASSFAKDISERIKSQAALKNSEERLKLAVEGANIGIWDWPDVNHPYQWWSERIYRIIGYEPGTIEAGFDKFKEMVAPEALPSVEQKLTEHFQRNSPFDVEFPAYVKSGEPRWFKAAGKCYRNAEGLPLRMTGTLLDITEKTKGQQALKLNEQKLREINKSKDKFFSILAHDLRSPFLALTGFSDLLYRENEIMDKDEIRLATKKIYDVSQKTFALLENVLSWARLQTGRMAASFEIFNTYEIADNVINLQKELAAKKNIQIINNMSKTLKVNADKNMIETVFRNLITNAIKFSNHYGIIKITEEASDDKIIFCVSDNGIGIAEDIIEKLFQIDQKVSSVGTSGEEGTGLGLILCKELINLNGGEIWVNSRPGAGASFYFSVPSAV